MDRPLQSFPTGRFRMFDVSFTELMVIGVIALIVIGPERLPKVARTIGHLMGRAQRYVNDVKSDIQREIELDELRKFKDEISNAAQDVQSSLRDTETSIRHAENSLRSELDSTAQAATSAVAGPPSAERTIAPPAPAEAAPPPATVEPPKAPATATQTGTPT